MTAVIFTAISAVERYDDFRLHGWIDIRRRHFVLQFQPQTGRMLYYAIVLFQCLASDPTTGDAIIDMPADSDTSKDHFQETH